MMAVRNWTRFLLWSWCLNLFLAKTDTLQTDQCRFLEHDERFALQYSDSDGDCACNDKQKGYQSSWANVDSITLFHADLLRAP